MGFSAMAQFVNQEMAAVVAENVYGQIQNNTMLSEVSPQATVVQDQQGVAAYYIFKYGDNNGFVVVSADERVYPVLAYSPKGSWEEEKPSPAVVDWMGVYLKQIEDVRSNNIKLNLIQIYEKVFFYNWNDNALY